MSTSASRLLGSWVYPGNTLSQIEIEPGEDADQVIVRDLAEQHWKKGVATLRLSEEEVVVIDICFDNGVSVRGSVSDEFDSINWENGTIWLRG